jgi:hypothetical protein
VLYPANDQVPPGACSPHGSEVTLYLGSSAVLAPGVFPLTIVGIKDKRVLVLDRSSDGSLVLIADIRDKDDKIIARLDKDGFTINKNNYLSVKRTDRSSLIIIDLCSAKNPYTANL